jgi:1-acyl-sn-glycerol-3-phosphate acyltransferase
MSEARGLRYRLGKLWLDALGWRVDGGPPNVRKAVVVAAPHTSNWDLPFTLATAAVLGIKISWIGKHTLFKPPFGGLLRALGGIPVDRRSRNNAVAAAIEVLDQHETLFLIIAPEGTRSRTERWKTGFYRIAEGAHVPVVLGFIDYGKKRGGLGTVFEPTGDLDGDMEKIAEFYRDIRGLHPEDESPVTLGSAAPKPDAVSSGRS